MLSKLPQLVERFRSDRRGTVALMFGLSLLPMMAMAGGAVDYAVASAAGARLQSALDSTALAVAHDAAQMTSAQVQSAAAARFAAVYQAGGTVTTLPTLTATISGNVVTVKAHTGVTPSFLGILGIKEWPIDASSSSVFKGKYDQIEIALVLDNTGSMNDNNKIVELKKAVNSLLDKLKSQSNQSSTTKVSIVPFNTQVKIGTSYRTASWLRFDAPATPLNWSGCITDRDQPYDTLATAPRVSQSAYVAFPCAYGGLSTMMPLTNDLAGVRRTTNAMTATGSTNVTVGFTMGLATLRSDSPFGRASSSGPGVAKYLILLTDGDNTQNRWSSDAYDIDRRLRAACQTARSSEPVHVFTVRVMDGNASLLRDCATDAASYYDVKNAAQLLPVFDSILNTINGIRLSS